jgi:hypothetical protein
MHHHTRSLTWRGESFRFEHLQSRGISSDPPQWAVSRRGEFIGTMSCGGDLTMEEFDRRCVGWLRELLGPARRSTRS